jgi:hypothetical protein
MALRSFVLAGLLALGAAGCSHDVTHLSFGSEYGLFFNDQGDTVALAYGLPNSDTVQLFLQCPKGQGRVEVSDVVRGNPVSALVLSSDGRRALIPVTVDPGESEGQRTLSGRTTLANPALAAFRRTGVIEVAQGPVRYTVTATSAERAGVERFFRVCERA